MRSSTMSFLRTLSFPRKRESIKIGAVPQVRACVRSGLSLFLACAFLLSDITYANPDVLSKPVGDFAKLEHKMTEALDAKLNLPQEPKIAADADAYAKAKAYQKHISDLVDSIAGIAGIEAMVKEGDDKYSISLARWFNHFFVDILQGLSNNSFFVYEDINTGKRNEAHIRRLTDNFSDLKILFSTFGSIAASDRAEFSKISVPAGTDADPVPYPQMTNFFQKRLFVDDANADHNWAVFRECVRKMDESLVKLDAAVQEIIAVVQPSAADLIRQGRLPASSDNSGGGSSDGIVGGPAGFENNRRIKEGEHDWTVEELIEKWRDGVIANIRDKNPEALETFAYQMALERNTPYTEDRYRARLALLKEAYLIGLSEGVRMLLTFTNDAFMRADLEKILTEPNQLRAAGDTVNQLSGVLRAAGDSEISQDQHEKSTANEKDGESAHILSSPLLTKVATANNTTNDTIPDVKTSTLNDEPGIKDPTTNAPNTSFPISYKALANSSRWDLPNLITDVSLSQDGNAVKRDEGHIQSGGGADGLGRFTRKALMENLGAFGIKVSMGENRIDFGKVPDNVDWVMDEIRPIEKRPIIIPEGTIKERDEKMPSVKLIHSLEEIEGLPPISMEGTNSKGVYVGLIEWQGRIRPAAIKFFTWSGYGELEYAQVRDRLGIGPRFYGIIKNDSGEIVGYAMQLAIGQAVSGPRLMTQHEKLFRSEDRRNTFKRTRDVGLEPPAEYLITRKNKVITIDAGDAEKQDSEKYSSFIRQMNEATTDEAVSTPKEIASAAPPAAAGLAMTAGEGTLPRAKRVTSATEFYELTTNRKEA